MAIASDLPRGQRSNLPRLRRGSTVIYLQMCNTWLSSLDLHLTRKYLQSSILRLEHYACVSFQKY